MEVVESFKIQCFVIASLDDTETTKKRIRLARAAFTMQSTLGSKRLRLSMRKKLYESIIPQLLLGLWR